MTASAAARNELIDCLPHVGEPEDTWTMARTDSLRAVLTADEEVIAALQWHEHFHRREGEDANDTFERIAEVFHSETGYLRPGKDCLIHSPEERTAAWDAWIAAGLAATRAAIAKAVQS